MKVSNLTINPKTPKLYKGKPYKRFNIPSEDYAPYIIVDSLPDYFDEGSISAWIKDMLNPIKNVYVWDLFLLYYLQSVMIHYTHDTGSPVFHYLFTFIRKNRSTLKGDLFKVVSERLTKILTDYLGGDWLYLGEPHPNEDNSVFTLQLSIG